MDGMGAPWVDDLGLTRLFARLPQAPLSQGVAVPVRKILRFEQDNALFLGDRGAQTLSNVLARFERIPFNAIDFGASHITEVGLKSIESILEKHPEITCLNLRDNGITGEKISWNISTPLHRLRELHLGFNKISDQGMKKLFRAQLDSALQYLDLQGNSFTYIGIFSLADFLKTNKTLTFLNLSKNRFGNLGAFGVAECLKSNHSLQTLEMRSCKIRDEGAKTLGKFLGMNKGLEDLDLSDNAIGDEGAMGLAAAFATNHTLKKLDLDGNHIQDAGACALAKAFLESNSPLEELRIQWNCLGPKGLACLAKLKEKRTKLIVMDTLQKPTECLGQGTSG